MTASPVLSKIYKKYRNKGVQIIGINPIDKDPIRLQKLLTQENIEYNTCLNTAELAKAYNITAYPAVLIFNSDKTLIKKIDYTPDMKAKLIEIIEYLLK